MSGYTEGFVYRIRIRLMWLVAPNSVQRFTLNGLENIEHTSQKIQEHNPQPGHVNEDASNIERRVQLLKSHLRLGDEQ